MAGLLIFYQREKLYAIVIEAAINQNMRYSCFIPSVVHTPAHLPLNRHSPYNQICGRNAGHLHQPVLRSIPSHIPAFAYLAPNVPSKRGRRYTTVLWNLFAKCSKNMLPRKNSPACASLRFRGRSLLPQC